MKWNGKTITSRHVVLVMLVGMCVGALLAVHYSTAFSGIGSRKGAGEQPGSHQPPEEETIAAADTSEEARLVDSLYETTGAQHPKDYVFPGTVTEEVSLFSCDSMLTPSEAQQELDDRGFTGIALTYDYDQNGRYLGGGVSEDDGACHPTYSGVYADDASVWLLMLVEDQLMATCVGGSEECIGIVVSENGQVTVFNSYTGELIEGVPDADEMAVVACSRLTPEALKSIAEEAAK
jgi:hypothetical protein